jgi:hypothetical protein
MSTQHRNPASSVDLGDLTEVVAISVRRALEEHEITAATPAVFHNPRVIVGFILEPAFLNPQPLPP